LLWTSTPHLASVICHPAFSIFCRLFLIFCSEFHTPHCSPHVERPQQLARPGRLVALVPREFLAAIERRAVGFVGGIVGRDGLTLGQQQRKPSVRPV
jgi:hypothetical protein